jgi:tRNA threonylcarbamoyladenosine biosynthesis protein TsaE
MKNLFSSKHTNSVSETIEYSCNFISNLEDKNCILILSGDLGAGKTHFTKGIFKGINYENYNDITSPTFDLVNTFKISDLIVHHFDLYRLDHLTKDDEMWLYELLNENSLCIIEWGDKFNFNLNKKIYIIEIKVLKENEREIKIFTN